jgi:hypothetical protein
MLVLCYRMSKLAKELGVVLPVRDSLIATHAHAYTGGVVCRYASPMCLAGCVLHTHTFGLRTKSLLQGSLR